MEPTITVLGTGKVGAAIAIDLKNSGYRVIAVDRDEEVLGKLAKDHGVEVHRGDFTGPASGEWISGADLVVGATPGELGYRVMKRVAELGKDMVDISFCPEDYLALDGLARKHGITVVPDMGVAPGLCNAMLGYMDTEMTVSSYRCLVGGLPFRRDWPLEYKSSWSMMDCIEEYTRPARIREKGRDVVKPAMSDLEQVDFPETGKLEAWNSDGLRSLLASFPAIPDMVEKTLRYPGTTEYLQVLRELGFFGRDPLGAAGREVTPLEVTAALLEPRFRLEPGEREFTFMHVEISGTRNGRKIAWNCDLYDETDPSTGTSSMARCTGYSATAAVSLLLDGALPGKGVVPPELLGASGVRFRAIREHLEQRGIRMRMDPLPD